MEQHGHAVAATEQPDEGVDGDEVETVEQVGHQIEEADAHFAHQLGYRDAHQHRRIGLKHTHIEREEGQHRQQVEVVGQQGGIL